ncbi:Smr/MutS family protein [Sphingomonas sp. LY54]|uniref:Smr/MutS family protein n=1 Tax=Sphingomonas sp. LY54 TaxID=3095343 RepID=UPI002D785444|nr:Smr/MutS family protein [Sphingomonas sp. LY54]WRP28618.1 Smr/MutS family protein [Sphingomonas sp. LY54]
MRRLNAEEKALWDKVVASVRPMHSRPPKDAEPAPVPPAERQAAAPTRATRAPAKPARPAAAPPPVVRPGSTLDGSWDRRLSRGIVQPDVTVDLHGHNLATAYHLLDSRLEQAIAMGARVMLLVTGKPPKGEPPIARGKIRAAVGDWLAASRHAGAIAAVRGAHPRHGGTGALYIVLRRPRGA